MKFKLIVLTIILISCEFMYGQKTIMIKATGTKTYPVTEIGVNLHINVTGNNADSVNTFGHKIGLTVIKYLKDNGYREIDILTTEAELTKEGSYRRDEEYTNTFNQGYSFTLKNIKLYDQIKSDLSKIGVTSISFYKGNPENIDALTKEAYQSAIKAAQKKAEFLSESFGYKKMKLLKIIDGEKEFNEYEVNLEKEFTNKNSVINISSASVAKSQNTIESTMTNLTDSISVDILIVFELTE